MNLLCHVASVASLVLSVICGISLFPGPSNGFYGGTALFLAFVIAGQGLVLIFAVGIPAGCIYLSGRRPASRLGILLFCGAMIAVVIEFFRVNAIPVTGGS